MKIPSGIALSILLSLGLTACPANDAQLADRTDPADTADPAADERDPADRPVCLRGVPFVAEGTIQVRGTGDEGDADSVSGLRWEAYEGCERFVIDLEGEGDAAAARAGRVEARVLRDLGVVRISLPDVQYVAPDATDARFGGSLARAAYVMWADEGRWIDVDVHLADAAEAHVAVLEDPARVVVDLRPGGGAVPEPPAEDSRVVVLDPRPGAVSYPLTVTGYARTFEANVVARLERGGEEVATDFTTATAWADAWGHFTITFREGPSGSVVLHVGEHSARDGTWEGVEVELEMR
jgi:hypothetical protein